MLKETLAALICECPYNESVVKNTVDRIEVCDGYILVKGYDGEFVFNETGAGDSVSIKNSGRQ